MQFDPTRAAALARLNAFAPRAGAAYAAQRNYDVPPHQGVSALSPYIRHRIITEPEVIQAVLARHDPRTADKFIAEVFWRTYWKGWLELRPTVWDRYTKARDAAWNTVQTQTALRRDWEAACLGTTGITCFDDWAQELVTTGYLHNHARMWFASIWIFTLRLPWELGADFFLRHLLDGDAASNTLSWRWVAGLQTVGKPYLATPDNIAKFTNGRYAPTGLATHATPLPPEASVPLGPCPVCAPPLADVPTALLVTADDLSAHRLTPAQMPLDQIGVILPDAPSPLATAPMVMQFKHAALQSTLGSQTPLVTGDTWIADLVDWAKSRGVTQIVTPYVPAGPTQPAIRALGQALAHHGITLRPQIHPHDRAAWPRATAGFFKFKKAIPDLLDAI